MIYGAAHRGYSAQFPENTITAFQAAIDLQFSHIELDVHLSSDGVPVVIHDYDVDRVSDHRGPVQSFTLAELQAIPLAGGERIPTLEESLSVLNGRVTVLVELKQAGLTYPDLERKALEVIYRTGTAEQVIIVSFDHFAMARVRELDPDIGIGITTTAAMPYVFDFAARMRLSLIGVPLRMMTPEYYQLILDAGIVHGPWMVDTLESMELIAQHYPQSLITTNEAQRWAQFYTEHPVLHQHMR